MRPILAATLLLSACANPDVERARDRVRQNLLDPASAQFRNERVVRDLVCGEVNAKNRMGGYNGFVRYMVETGGRFIQLEKSGGDETFQERWTEECA